MNCPKCGRQLPNNAANPKWCPFCGAQLAAAAQPTAPVNPPAPPLQKLTQQPLATDPKAALTGAFSDFYARYGSDAVADGTFLLQHFSPSQPSLATFAPLVDAFVRSGGNTYLCQGGISRKERAAHAEQVIAHMVNACRVHEADARFICDCFCAAVPVIKAAPAAKKSSGKKNWLIPIIIIAALLLATAMFFGVRFMIDNDWDFAAVFSSDAASADDDDERGNRDKDKDDEGDESDEEDGGTGSTSSAADSDRPASGDEQPADSPSADAPATDSEAPSEDRQPTPGSGSAAAAEPEEVPDTEQTEATVDTAPSGDGDYIPDGVWDAGNGNYLLCSGLFSLEMPTELFDHLVVEIDSDGESIRIRELHAHEAGYGGLVMNISLQDSDYTYHPSYSLLGNLTTPDGKVYDVVAFFPTDVQYDPDGDPICIEFYMMAVEYSYFMLDSISGVNGCTFRPQSTTAVLSQYINEMPFYEKFGKLWLHEDRYYSDGNNDPWDYDAIGHIDGPVRDNQGNTYRYGLHLDGSTVDPFYVTYELNGLYSTFSGTVILPDSMIGTDVEKVIEIYCDGILVFGSNIMQDGCDPQYFEIDVTGVNYLTIQYPAIDGSNEGAVLCDGLLQ